MNISVCFSFSVSAVLAECGLMMTLGMSQKGLSGGRGSFQKMSDAKPPRYPELRALIRAGSSTMLPLEMFIRTAPFFIAAIAFSLMRPSV